MSQNSIFRITARQFHSLLRLPICLAAALSAAAGYVLAKGEASWEMLFPTLGAFSLCAGASVLNQIQEFDIDAKMSRTKDRLIVSGAVNPQAAWGLSMQFLFMGVVVLLAAPGVTMALGIAAVLLYNAVYTPLKRKTILAMPVGAVVGAVPVLMGWSATGRAIWEPHAIALALFYWLWQMPHFWLLLMRHEEDYKSAGLPTLPAMLSKSQMARVISAWALALAVMSVVLPGFFKLSSAIFVIVPIALWLSFGAIRFAIGHERALSAHVINAHMALTVLALTIVRLS